MVPANNKNKPGTKVFLHLKQFMPCLKGVLRKLVAQVKVKPVIG